MASDVKRVFGNLGLLLSGKAVAGLLSLVYLVIVARTLGARDYGVLILIHAYVTLVGGIVAFSGWHGLVRFGTIALEAGDHERLLKVGRFLSLLEAAFVVAAILVAIVLVPVIGPHLDWPSDAMRFATVYSLATLANVRSTPLGLLQLANRFDLIATHQLVMPTVRLVGSVIVWWLGGGLIGFLGVWLAAAIAEWASMWALGLWVLHRMRLDARVFGSVRGAIAEKLIAMGLPSRSIMVNLLANVLLLPLLPLFLLRFGLNGVGWHAIVQSAAAGLALTTRGECRKLVMARGAY